MSPQLSAPDADNSLKKKCRTIPANIFGNARTATRLLNLKREIAAYFAPMVIPHVRRFKKGHHAAN